MSEDLGNLAVRRFRNAEHALEECIVQLMVNNKDKIFRLDKYGAKPRVLLRSAGRNGC